MANNNDDFFGPLEEIFNSANYGRRSVNGSSDINNLSGMRGVQTKPRRTDNGLPRANNQTRNMSYKPAGMQSKSNHQVSASRKNVNLKLGRQNIGESSIRVTKRKINPLIIKVGAVAIAGVVAVVGFSNVIKNLFEKQDPVDTSKTSVSIDKDSLKKSADTSKDMSEDSKSVNDYSSKSSRYFVSNSQNMTKCEEFKQTEFGKYVKRVCIKYGQDYDLLVAQFYLESHLEHYDVLPAYYFVGSSPVTNDNGQNWFNGTGYGMTQLTVDGSVYDARVVATNELVELTNNEENAADPYTNVELGVMLWQDNQFRTFYLILESYNEAIGIKDCFTYDNIKKILNGESVDLPVADEKKCVNQIMSALGIASLDNYNHGLGNFENYILPGIFDENGNFLYDKYRQNIYDFCSTHEDSGDPKYIDNVMANFNNDEFKFYVNKLDGFATFSICRNPSECFVKFEPKDVVYSYEEDQFKMR